MLWIFRVSTRLSGGTFDGRDVNVMKEHAVDDKPSHAKGLDRRRMVVERRSREP